jgi:hypothetical protein
MAGKLSTGLRNFRANGGSLRKAFDDAVLNIYSGVAPTEADDAPTGTLLAKITLASGALAANARSTPKRYKVTITSHVADSTFKLNLTVDGVGPTTYTFTNTPDAGGVDDVAKLVALMLNDIPQLIAVAEGANGNLYVQGDIAGLDFTLADGGGTGTLTVTTVEAAARVNSLQLGAPTLGVYTKSSDIWSGLGLAAGAAGYFRLVTSRDLGTDNTTDLRLQGTVSTSGAELNLSNINIAAGATQTIDTFQLTEPESAS